MKSTQVRTSLDEGGEDEVVGVDAGGEKGAGDGEGTVRAVGEVAGG